MPRDADIIKWLLNPDCQPELVLIPDLEQTEVSDLSDDDISESNFDETSSCSDNDEDFERNSSIDETDDDELLYSNAAMTVSETMILLMTYAIRHSLTYTAFSDLLEIISFICPQPNKCKSSVKQIWKYFGNLDAEKIVHYYCNFCTQYLCADNPPIETEVCSGCGKIVGKNIPYFLQIPFQQQIQILFKKEEFPAILNHRFNSNPSGIEDIYDGALYQELFREGEFLFNPNNISFQMNTDGVAIFKSSNVSVWPIYLTINELPPKVRFSRDMRIFTGLWFGSTKPKMTTFLRPFSEELFDTYNNGISVRINEQDVIVRAILLSVCLDAPARCMFQGFTQFNGESGCGYCTEKGKVVLSGKGHARIYPFNEANVNKLGHDAVRTHCETRKNAVCATQHLENQQRAKHNVNGVIAMSWGLILPKFNIILGTPVDYMHAVLLGVVKLLITLWFGKSFSKYPWSCLKKIKQCDDKRKSIAPPDFVKRIPRSLEVYGTKYKASEYRTWLLYYLFPVMKDILPNVYLNHAMLLVNGIYLLLKSAITSDDLKNSTLLLQHFCLRMPSLYLESKCTYNIHQLLHLPSCVKNHGPLWTFSCFFYEDLNGDLRKLFHGSQNFEMQIANASSLLQKISNNENMLHNKQGLHIYHRMTHTRGNGPRTRHPISEEINFFGRPHILKITKEEKDAIYSYKGSNVNEVEQFFRFEAKNVLYHTAAYKRVTKRNSYTVLLSENEGNAVAFVQYAFAYQTFCGHACCRVSKKCKDSPKDFGVMVWICENAPELQPNSASLVGPVATMDFVRAVKPAKSVYTCKAVNPADVIAKLVYVELGLDEGYAFTSPNDIEKE